MPANPRGVTLSELDRLSRVETLHLDPHSEHNCTWEQWRELVEAARAWVLLEESGRSLIGDKYGWAVSGFAPSKPTPQAAVLAALKGAKT